MKTSHNKWIRLRIYIVMIGFLVFFTVILARAFQLQVVRAKHLRTLAEKEYTRRIPLVTERGVIYDRHMETLAISGSACSIFANPLQITDPDSVASRLSTILKLNKRNLSRELKKKKSFVWIKRQVTDKEAETVKRLKIEGIHFLQENRRYYPHVYLACHVLGFAGVDAQGLEGLELKYDHYLKRKISYSYTIQDAIKRRIYPCLDFDSSAQSHDLILTIDKRIQYITEASLRKVIQKTKAKGAMCIVMNPKTGEILAMANYPPFNSNAFGEYHPSLRRNRAVTDTFEPGSIFKPFLIAAALEEGATKIDDIFFCENGRYHVENTSIVVNDVHKYDWLSVPQIIRFSSNIGVTKIGQKLDPRCLYRYTKSFGFGERTEIDLPGEVRGLINPPVRWSKADRYTMCFGQGIATTAIQVITALSSIANDGVLMRPFVVREIRDKNGRIIKRFTSHVVRRVISSKTSCDVTSILEGVVKEGGTGEMAHIEGYTVAGKTGTAQKVEPYGNGYSKNKYVASFMGFVPSEDPRVAILVVVDEPKGTKYGGVVAAPVFKEIAQRSLICLNIPPREVLIVKNDQGRTIGQIREGIAN